LIDSNLFSLCVDDDGGASALGAKIIERFREKSLILIAPTSAWMHVGRAMQEQRSGVPRADAPTK